INIRVGTLGNSTLTVTGVNGFAGTVHLTVPTSPATGLSCPLSTINIAGSGTSAMSCASSASRTLTVTVTGTRGSLSHSTTISISVIKAQPSITTSLSASSILTVGSVYDSAVLSNAFEAWGTFTYKYYPGS